MNEYERTDSITIELLKAIAKKYKSAARKIVGNPSSLAAFDEINLLFKEVNELANKAFVTIMRLGYDQLGKKKRIYDIEDILELEGYYDPTCEYIYEKEYERKKERLKESVLAVIENYNVRSRKVGKQAEKQAETDNIRQSLTREWGETPYATQETEEVTQHCVIPISEIEKQFDRAYAQIALMVQQASIRFTDEARLDAMEENGTKRVKWVANMDERTCDECWGLNGQTFPIDEVPAKHYRCRCVLKPVK